MKTSFSHVEGSRVRAGVLLSYPGDRFGVFIFRPNAKTQINVVADDGAESGWEHVSVSVIYQNAQGRCVDRTPTWQEMCDVKRRFWDDHETVVQFHPRADHYVNFHAHCLHLWKQVGVEYPLPNHMMVGPSGNLEKDVAAMEELDAALEGSEK